MSNIIYEKAKENYPEIWTFEMLVRLVQKGRLTVAQFEEITHQPYVG